MDGAEPTSSLGDANRRREPVWRVVGVSIAAGLLSGLHTLLARANEPGPFVLVGHSAGGPYVADPEAWR
jgi:hypothetical protein